MYQIPLFDLNYGIEEEDAVLAVLRSKWISAGPKCEELEGRFAEMLNAKYALAVTNCTAALFLACYSLGIGTGDEVICPSLSFAATSNCIRYTGATPVFCDIVGMDNLCMDAEKIEPLITERTKAIIPMHYAGFPCDMDGISALAKKYHLSLIEDACHGPKSLYHGKAVGTFGDAGCFSFFSNKNISTGEGGIITFQDGELYQKCRLLRSHGMTTMSYQRASGHATKYDIVELGFNFRMDDIRAALAISQLNKLDADIEKRAKIRAQYEELLGGCQGLTIPFMHHSERCSNYIFPVVLNHSDVGYRDAIRQKLHDKGIQTSVHYPAIHRFSIYKEFSCSLPNTEYITDNEITLPMYGNLTEDQVQYICETIIQLIREK